MSKTISKSIGEGWGRNPIYAALAYDANDRFGGYQIKDIMHNTTYKEYFYDTDASVYATASGALAIAGATSITLTGTTIAVTGNQTISGNLTITGSLQYGSVSIPLAQSLTGPLTVGSSGSGNDVLFYGTTALYQWLWDESANGVVMKGTWTCVGDLTITGGVGIDGDVTMAGDDQINFRTTSIYIQSGDAGHLDLVANTAIDITATTMTLTGIAAVVGTITSTGSLTITPTAAGTFIDFNLLDEYVSGTLINADFGEATTVTDHVIGMLLDLSGNVTMTTAKNVTGYQVKTPGIDQTAANTTTIIGFDLYSASAIDQSSAAGTVTFKGVNIVMPNTDRAAGTVTAYGVYLDAGSITSTSTQVGIYMKDTMTTGIEFSSSCTNFINFNNVGTTSVIALHFKAAFLGHSIETGTYQSTADGGVILDSTNTFNAGFLADDSGSNIGASVRNVLARTLLTATQSGSSIRSLMGQLKILTDIDVGTGVYTAVQGYIELVGNTDVASGGKMSGMDISLEVASGATFTIDSGGLFAGLKIETTGAGTITNNGTCAAIYIDDGGTVTDWPVGVDINNCTTGIDIDSATTGINLTGTFSTVGLIFSGICTESAISIGGTYDHGIYFTEDPQAGDVTNSFINIGNYTTGIAVAPTSANMFGVMHNVTLAVNVAYWYQAYYTKITTSGTTTSTSIAGHALRINIATNIEAAYGIQCHTNITAGANVTQEVISVSAMVDLGTGETTSDRVCALQAMITGSGTAGTVVGDAIVAYLVNAGTVITTDAICKIFNQSAATATIGLHIDNDGTITDMIKVDGSATYLFNLDDASTFISSGGTDCTASAATDPAYTIKIKDPAGAAGYIRVWAAA